jgi:hypothetical protein
MSAPALELIELTMAAKRDDKTVKIERGLATKISLIVEAFTLDGMDISVGKYISDALRPLVAKDMERASKIIEKHNRKTESK